MIVIATDAPLAHRELERVAERAFAGIARTGSWMSHGSGDYAIAFSTHRGAVELADGELLTRLFVAAAEAVEEAVLNSSVQGNDRRGLPWPPRRSSAGARRAGDSSAAQSLRKGRRRVAGGSVLVGECGARLLDIPPDPGSQIVQVLTVHSHCWHGIQDPHHDVSVSELHRPLAYGRPCSMHGHRKDRQRPSRSLTGRLHFGKEASRCVRERVPSGKIMIDAPRRSHLRSPLYEAPRLPASLLSTPTSPAIRIIWPRNGTRKMDDLDSHFMSHGSHPIRMMSARDSWLATATKG